MSKQAVAVDNRGVKRLLFWGELDEESVAVSPADGGVREEMFHAALIRTLTANDGIFLQLSSTIVLHLLCLCYRRLY